MKPCRLAGLLLCLAACTAAPAPLQTIRAADFLDTLGICVHVRQSNPASLIEALKHLGVRHVRTDPPRLKQLTAANPYEMLATNGVGATYFINSGLEGGDLGDRELEALDLIETRHPGSLDAIEGPNEVNNWPIHYRGMADNKGHAWPGGRRAIEAFQQDLYSRVRKDVRLSNLPVIDYTDIHPVHGLADYSNIHIYPAKRWIDDEVRKGAAQMNQKAPGRRLAATEWGYTTPLALGVKGVSLHDQAEHILEGWAVLIRSGFERVFIYDLHDDGADPLDPEDHYGLFNQDWTPKPSAVALSNLIRLVRDDGPGAKTFVPKPLGLNTNGAPSLVVAKSDGSYIVLVWSSDLTRPVHLSLKFPSGVVVQRVDPFSGGSQVQSRASTFDVGPLSGLAVLKVNRL